MAKLHNPTSIGSDPRPQPRRTSGCLDHLASRLEMGRVVEIRGEFDWCFSSCFCKPMIMSRLTITQGPGAGQTIEPSDTGVVIGRQPGLEVTLDSGAISRRHARLTWEGERVYVEDLKSSNGTFINENRITARTLLRPGDTLRIGSSILRLTVPEPRLDPDMTLGAGTR